MKFKIVYADELCKVQKEMNALLIDIRTREEYDRSALERRTQYAYGYHGFI